MVSMPVRFYFAGGADRRFVCFYIQGNYSGQDVVSLSMWTLFMAFCFDPNYV